VSVSLKEKLELVRSYRKGDINPGAICQSVLRKESQGLALEIAKIQEVFERRLQSMQQLFQESLEEARELRPMAVAEEQKGNLEQTLQQLSLSIEAIKQDIAKAQDQVPIEQKRVGELKQILARYGQALRIPESDGITRGLNQFGQEVAKYNQYKRPHK